MEKPGVRSQESEFRMLMRCGCIFSLLFVRSVPRNTLGVRSQEPEVRIDLEYASRSLLTSSSCPINAVVSPYPRSAERIR